MIVLVFLLSFSGRLVVAGEFKSHVANQIHISDVNNTISVDVSPRNGGFVELDEVESMAHCEEGILYFNDAVVVNVSKENAARCSTGCHGGDGCDQHCAAEYDCDKSEVLFHNFRSFL